MKKKILQINIVCGTGSTGRIVVDIGKTIEKENMESYIAYGYGKTNLNNTIKIGTTIEYYIHNILSRIFGTQGRFSYFATKRFLKKVDKIKPDIIHLHNLHGNYINYKVLFKYIKMKKIPVVWTLHDCWPFTGKCVYFDYIQCNKWQKGCYNCENLKEYPKNYIDNSKKEYKSKKETFTNIKNMTIISPSKWLGENIKESFIGQYKIKVINNGIDLDKFKYIENNYKEKLNINDKYVLLGVASDWNKRKGLDTFVQLSKEIDNKYQIILVGISDEQKEKLPKNIIVINKTNSIEELAKIYSIADIFINPTLQDNFPTTNLEALACGTPVITYKTGGSPEAIDVTCGAIVEKNNIEELKKTIEEIINKKIKRETCIEHSKKFNKKERFLDYIETYKEILGE